MCVGALEASFELKPFIQDKKVARAIEAALNKYAAELSSIESKLGQELDPNTRAELERRRVEISTAVSGLNREMVDNRRELSNSLVLNLTIGD